MTRRVQVPDSAGGQRLDVVLAEQLGESRSQVQKLIKNGLVTTNDGSAVDAKQAAVPGQELIVAEAPTEPVSAVPDITILYEDDDVLVVDKPAGLVVHAPETGREQPTVAAFAAAHGIVDDDPERPGIVHRLDKDTSGALVLAKNPAAKAFLQRQFKDRLVGKTYVALVRGHLQEPEAVIRLPIGRHRSQPVKRAVVSGGRPAETRYRTLRPYARETLIEVQLHTGRTHQIRVHFSHLGHPVIGDTLYGSRQRPAGLHRQFLHAGRLEFEAPSGKRVVVESPLPPELQTFLDGLPD